MDRRYQSYIETASSLIAASDGREPFSISLRKFFSAHKKYGSTDRKQIAHLCYCFFRTAHLFDCKPEQEHIIASLLLCSTSSNLLLENVRPDWNNLATLSLTKKLEAIGKEGALKKLFPWQEELSPAIDDTGFISSLLVQPDLFLRMRPGKQERVMTQLEKAGIPFKRHGEYALSLSNNTSIEKVLAIDEDVVIQDLSSQRVGEILSEAVTLSCKTWDCCAASGGKSIMAYDLYPKMELTVSDIRENILLNLKQRFRKAGILNYRSFVTDLSKPGITLPKQEYDLIIADVPCTGSGTWGRTPEQLCFFDQKKIGEYAVLQQKIIENVIGSLKKEAKLLYITCSVFKKENEDQLAFFQNNLGLKLLKSELFTGYHQGADTMFAALFS